MSKLDTLATIDAHITHLNSVTRHMDEETASWLWVITAHLTDLACDLEEEIITETLTQN